MKKFIFIIFLTFLVFSGQACSRRNYDLGIYKSFDGGNNWEQKVKVGKKKALATFEILSLALDPQNSNVIYAGTKGKGIYKSVDGAESWEKTFITQGEITSVVVDLKDSNIVYATSYVGDFGKIYKSEDGGGKFEEIYSETHQQIPVYSLALDWYDSRKIWAGTKKGAILKSEDSGRNWIVKKWLASEVVQIAISSKDSRHIVVGTRTDGLWKTEDGGKNWRQINETFLKKDNKINPKEKLQVHSLVFDTASPGTLYFTSQFQFLRSQDEGKNWQEIELLTKPQEASSLKVALDPNDSEKIYLGLDSNIYKSEDGGKNWKVKKFTSGRIATLVVDPQDSVKIYAGIRQPEQ
jgi:photosystem II stability/assembly factor-like uncharacterized protein